MCCPTFRTRRSNPDLRTDRHSALTTAGRQTELRSDPLLQFVAVRFRTRWLCGCLHRRSGVFDGHGDVDVLSDAGSGTRVEASNSVRSALARRLFDGIRVTRINGLGIQPEMHHNLRAERLNQRRLGCRATILRHPVKHCGVFEVFWRDADDDRLAVVSLETRPRCEYVLVKPDRMRTERDVAAVSRNVGSSPLIEVH